MRLLGLDPGLRHTGWGVVDVAGNRLSHVAAGVVHSRDGENLATRLVDLLREETHTCYLGDRAHRHEWGYGCGRCPACDLRRRGWAAYASGAHACGAPDV